MWGDADQAHPAITRFDEDTDGSAPGPPLTSVVMVISQSIVSDNPSDAPDRKSVV